MAINFLAMIAIAFAMQILSYVITPKPKRPKPDAVKDAEGPTAEAGIEWPVFFGTIRYQSPNCIGAWDKSSRQLQIKA